MPDDPRGIMDAAIEKKLKETGSSAALSGADVEAKYGLGIEVPLCLQWLLTTNILPFNLIAQVHGPKDTAKTSLVLAIARMFVDVGGMVIWNDSENKFPFDVAKSFIGEEEIYDTDVFRYHPVESTKRAQDRILRYIQAMKEANTDIRIHNLREVMTKNSAEKYINLLPWRVLQTALGLKEKVRKNFLRSCAKKKRAREFRPDKAIEEVRGLLDEQDGEVDLGDQWPERCAIIVYDSLAGSLSPQDLERIDKDGFGGQQIAPYARAWREPLSRLSAELVDSNCTFFIVNHEREAIEYTGLTMPGGRHLMHMVSLDLRTKENKSASASSKEFEAEKEVAISITCQKNSFGARDRVIHQLPWWYDVDRNFGFRFGFAFANMLKRYFSESGTEPLGEMENLTQNKGLFSSDHLELSSATGEEVEDAVKGRPEVLSALRRRWGIIERPVFKPEAEPAVLHSQEGDAGGPGDSEGSGQESVGEDSD